MKMPARKSVITALAVAGVLGGLAWLALREPVQLASVAQVRTAPMSEQFSEEGKTRLKARYSITAPVAGTLQRITLQPGDRVQAGQTVAWIDPATPGLLDVRSRTQLQAELAAARRQAQSARHHVNAARASLDQASSALKRAQALRAGNAISQEALENAQLQASTTRANWSAARADAQTAQQRVAAAEAALLEGDPASDGSVRREPVAVRAPVDGLVLKRPLESAVPVTLGQQLLEMGDTEQLEVEAEVLSSDAVRVRPGMKARLLRWGGPGVLEAHVTRVEPGGFTKVSALGVDEQRTRVILDIDSPREQWAALGDAYRAELEFVLRHEDRVLQVPASALFVDTKQAGDAAGEPAAKEAAGAFSAQQGQQGQQAQQEGGLRYAVFRVEDGRARLVPVKTGMRSASHVQVLDGLKEGDRVILQPDDRISDGVRIEGH